MEEVEEGKSRKWSQKSWNNDFWWLPRGFIYPLAPCLGPLIMTPKVTEKTAPSKIEASTEKILGKRSVHVILTIFGYSDTVTPTRTL